VLDHQVANSLEEARQMQAGNNQHHGEEQDQGCEVDALQRLSWREHAEHEHERGADNRHRRPVDLGSRQMPEGEDKVACEKDEPCDDNVKVRERVAYCLNHGARVVHDAGGAMQSKYCIRHSAAVVQFPGFRKLPCPCAAFLHRGAAHPTIGFTLAEHTPLA